METTFSPFAMTTLARPVHGILLARVPRSEVEDLVQEAIAASRLVVLSGSWLALNRNHSAWQVSALAGAPQVSRLERGESLRRCGTL